MVRIVALLALVWVERAHRCLIVQNSLGFRVLLGYGGQESSSLMSRIALRLSNWFWFLVYILGNTFGKEIMF